MEIESTKIALFKGKKIRKTIYPVRYKLSNGVNQNEWWFVIVDVISVLTDSIQPDGYIKDMRRRDPELSKGWVQIATPLTIKTDGGPQKINCANVEGIFRIIQSIPSPKAEPFKRWLARVGYERVHPVRYKLSNGVKKLKDWSISLYVLCIYSTKLEGQPVLCGLY